MRPSTRWHLVNQGFNDDGHHPGTLHVERVGSTQREVEDASASVWAAVVDLTMTERLLSRLVRGCGFGKGALRGQFAPDSSLEEDGYRTLRPAPPQALL